MTAAIVLFNAAVCAQAQSVRIATYNAELTRKGPGLLLRDIMRGEDDQIAAFRQLLIDVSPDIVALQGIDFDLRRTTLEALADDLASSGLNYPYRFANPPNAGQASGLDLNGNGRLGDADDAHGFGRFNGMGGMAVLSRFPITLDAIEDYSALLWRNLPKNIYPMNGNIPFGGKDVLASHRLSSRGHWIVPVQIPDVGTLNLMTFHATPPIYDGEEDRNGRRNHDEVAFWLDYLKNATATSLFVLTGTANVDPDRGSGRKDAINALLAHPSLQDPFDDTPTADFAEPLPGDLRVDYLLPSTGWRVLDHGMVHRPDASRHSLLWADIAPRNP